MGQITNADRPMRALAELVVGSPVFPGYYDALPVLARRGLAEQIEVRGRTEWRATEAGRVLVAERWAEMRKARDRRSSRDE